MSVTPDYNSYLRLARQPGDVAITSNEPTFRYQFAQLQPASRSLTVRILGINRVDGSNKMLIVKTPTKDFCHPHVGREKQWHHAIDRFSTICCKVHPDGRRNIRNLSFVGAQSVRNASYAHASYLSPRARALRTALHVGLCPDKGSLHLAPADWCSPRSRRRSGRPRQLADKSHTGAREGQGCGRAQRLARAGRSGRRSEDAEGHPEAAPG